MTMLAPTHTSENAEIVIDPHERWWVSRTNLLEQVRGGQQLPARVHLRDCTIREGEEMAGAFLTIEQKLELARAAQDLGIDEIEIGYCGSIREHEELAGLFRREGITTKLTSLNRSYVRDGEWQTEVDRAVAAGANVIYFIAFCNDDLLASVPWLEKNNVPARIEECVRYAKQANVEVMYTLAGASRTEPRWVAECARAAASGGADVVGVADSMGCALPEAAEYLVRLTREAVGPGPRIAFHGHNTFGLATANALAAVRAGAELIDAVPLGIGEGAGIAPLEEITAALEVLYGVNTGLDLGKVADFARLAQRAFQVTPMPTKTVIGSALYRHSIDSHIASILRGKWHSWECIHPRAVGQERALEFGYAKIRRGRSGAIGAKIEQLGFQADDQQVDRIIDRVSTIAAKNRWATEKDVEVVIREELRDSGNGAHA
jgi:(R)-citramalate synthase